MTGVALAGEPRCVPGDHLDNREALVLLDQLLALGVLVIGAIAKWVAYERTDSYSMEVSQIAHRQPTSPHSQRKEAIPRSVGASARKRAVDSLSTRERACASDSRSRQLPIAVPVPVAGAVAGSVDGRVERGVDVEQLVALGELEDPDHVRIRQDEHLSSAGPLPRDEQGP